MHGPEWVLRAADDFGITGMSDDAIRVILNDARYCAARRANRLTPEYKKHRAEERKKKTQRRLRETAAGQRSTHAPRNPPRRPGVRAPLIDPAMRA
jgi:hypothetical protein